MRDYAQMKATVISLPQVVPFQGGSLEICVLGQIADIPEGVELRSIHPIHLGTSEKGVDSIPKVGSVIEVTFFQHFYDHGTTVGPRFVWLPS